MKVAAILMVIYGFLGLLLGFFWLFDSVKYSQFYGGNWAELTQAASLLIISASFAGFAGAFHAGTHRRFIVAAPVIMLQVVASVFIFTALFALVRQAFRLIEEASVPIHTPEGGKRALKDTISYQVLRALVVMAVIIGGFLLFTFIGAPFANTPLFLLILIVVILVLAIVFQRSVSSFNDRFKSTFYEGLQVKGEEEPIEVPDEPKRDLAVPQLLSEGDKLCNVTVEAASEERGRPLKESEMWKREDVAVLAIRREDELFIDPDGDEVLEENDVIILLEGCTIGTSDVENLELESTP